MDVTDNRKIICYRLRCVGSLARKEKQYVLLNGDIRS